MNELELIAEARSVRDDGQEPKSPAEDYDRALLFVARREASATESFPAALARVVQTDDDAACLIFAADRRRAADAHVGKSAPQPEAAPSPVAQDAQRVAKSGTAPRYTRDRYEDEMLSLSKQLALPGEDTVSAFARLAGDGRFDDLYAAGERADAAEAEAAMAKAAPDDRFYPLLMDLASMRKRAGETIEAACARLLEEDSTVRDAYAATQGL